MNFFSEKDCKFCGEQMTIDDEHNYKDICFTCCSYAWKAYEIAHGGVCKTDIKKRHVTRSMKASIIARDGGVCLKCGTTDKLTIDHITPLANGGDNHHSNLQTLCAKCNSLKSDTVSDFREVIQ